AGQLFPGGDDRPMHCGDGCDRPREPRAGPVQTRALGAADRRRHGGACAGRFAFRRRGEHDETERAESAGEHAAERRAASEDPARQPAARDWTFVGCASAHRLFNSDRNNRCAEAHPTRTLMTPKLSELLSVATEAAYIAGRRTLAYFNTPIDIDTKADE